MKKEKRKLMPGMLDFINFKNPLLLKIIFYPPLMRFGFQQLELYFRIANLPVINRFHPWVKNENTKMFIVPVEKTLDRPDDVALPYQLVERFIEKSSHRVIMDFCGCRKSFECKNYSPDIGCLMMGEDVKKIPAAWAKPATKEEAREHLKKAVEAGLPAFIGKARVDNYVFGVPDNGRLLTVCFCCECCCIGSMTKHLPPDKRNVQFNRLSGLRVWVDEDKCQGCGSCVDKCYLSLIQLSGGKAYIPEDCRGCGRCVKYCPEGAIHLKLENPDFLEQAVRTIERMVQP